ncbi:hypothetical protein EVAR_57999_1 [Eumeta japonica]|uniref:Uncharacterized protein n=1 Tax=Eumeta variegata TaxID=151549 RepID=A0A4C1YA29_EUMVA|nr:hypothetical protein EVAR_57999_1 [Eumeta japonica]
MVAYNGDKLRKAYLRVLALRTGPPSALAIAVDILSTVVVLETECLESGIGTVLVYEIEIEQGIRKIAGFERSVIEREKKNTMANLATAQKRGGSTGEIQHSHRIRT